MPARRGGPRARPTARRDAHDARAAAVRALYPWVRHASPVARQEVAATLGAIGGPAALAEIDRLLADPVDRVRRAAVLAYGQAGGTGAGALRRVRSFLDDPAARVRAAAAVVLGRRHDRRSVRALLARLEAPGTWEKPSVAVALGRIGDPAALPALIRLAAQPERWLRVCAIHALGEIGASEARPTVRRALADPAWSVRGAAAVALGTLGTARDTAPLVALARDPHPWARRGAVYALGRLGRREALATVRAALDDPEADVRLAACWSLGALSDRSSRRALARLLAACSAPSPPGAERPPADAALPASGAEGRLFETAVAALARIGPSPRDAVVERALAAAETRAGATVLARTVPSPFPVGEPASAPPTLAELFRDARVGPRGVR